MSQSSSAPATDTSVTQTANKPTLLLIDGHSLAFRAYYAFSNSREGGLRTSQGVPTSICFGFLNSLLETLKLEQPNAVAVAFDLPEPTFRHKADDSYKANRPETPEDFIPDMNNLQRLLQAFDFSIVTAPGFEADDVLGTLAQQGSAAGYQIKILSGDRDLFQLVDADKDISVLYLSNTFGRRSAAAAPNQFGPVEVEKKLDVPPSLVVDYKALCGDSSDNISGVRGVGPKTAVKLLKEHGSLDGIYQALDGMKAGALKKKLETQKESAYHSQFMARIVVDVPLTVALGDLQLKGFEDAAVEPILRELELHSFLNRIAKLKQAFSGQYETKSSQAESKTIAVPVALEDEDISFFTAEETEALREQQRIPIQPQIIDTPAKLAELVRHLETCTDPAVPVAWDTETTSLEPRDAQLVGIGCCWGAAPTETAYIPIEHTTGKTLNKDEVVAALYPILESADYPKVLQNAKYDRLVLYFQGIQLAGTIFDTMLASYVLNPEASHNLSELSLKYLNLQAQSYEDLVPKGKTIADIEIPAVAIYCGMDAYTTFCLVEKLQAELAAAPSVQRLLTKIELPLEPVLAEMEYWGVRIDQPYLQQLSEELEADLAAIEQRAYAAAGEEFNLGSPKQLSALLFGKLQLSKKKSRKTKLGYSTDAATLEKLQGDHPVIDTILEYRTLAKLKSTYVDALPVLVHPETQRVHTDFNQAITATGRLSSSNPNLQNIPIRTAFSRRIRKGFVPEPGWQLVAADYSQIELRILAHLSGEPVLIEAYQNNRDVHALTTQLVLEKEEITPDERRLGKTINFGAIYGMGAQRFAKATGVSLAEGKQFIDRFHQRYAKVFDYLQQMKRCAIAQGYVETLYGRRRYFHFDSNYLRNLRGKAPDEIDLASLKLGRNDAAQLRAAANAPIQGSSADIIKIAMVNLHQMLQPYHARLLLQVHDELVFELPPDEWETLEPQICEGMEGAIALKVPLVVDIHAGQNWMEAK